MNNSNKGIVFPINPLMAEDVAILLKYCTPEGIGRRYELSAKRLRMLIILMYRSGLRISETLDLEFRDILINDHCLKVRHGKGDKQRIVAIDNWAVTLLIMVVGVPGIAVFAGEAERGD